MTLRKEYSSYKDSEYGLIGLIPVDWKMMKWKYLTNEQLMYGANESAESDDVNLPRYIRITDIDSFGNLKNDTFRSLPMEQAKSYMLKKGDLLLARSGATVGKTYIHENDIEACFAGYLIRYRTNQKKVLPRFVYYYTQTQVFSNWIKDNTIQATIQNVSAEKYANVSMPVPPINEQNQVIVFLNERTSEIDSLITDKEKLITLLEEKRQAVITEAVTKGLNSDVEMKDSGVEWIGEIPEHWKLGKLKNISSRIGDGLHGTPTYDDTGQYHFINGNNLGSKSLIMEEGTNRINEDEYSKYKSNLTDRTIFISLNGTVGNLSIYNGEAVMLSKSVGYINLTDIDLEFVYFYLKSSYVKTYFELSFAGTTINNLSLETLRKTMIFIPPMDEQKDIVDYLMVKTMEIDSLIRDGKDTITLLKEYRQSLIYEAVTGKIDVRDYIEKTN